MSVRNYSPREIASITKPDGSKLYGEAAMYERILKDLDASGKEWHFFYNLKLNLKVKDKSHIEIDFFVICDEGAVIIEVKGGIVSVSRGQYHVSQHSGGSLPLRQSPYDQADDYRNALWNNQVINKRELFVEIACAFPFTPRFQTSTDQSLDISSKTWFSDQHNDSRASFADFCLDVIRSGKSAIPNFHDHILTTREVRLLVEKFAPTVCTSTGYSESDVDDILEWLKVDDVNTLLSLSKNPRIVIEGGPGTGKTTIAKAYIKKYSSQRGLYLCKNALLAERMRYLLEQENLKNCLVYQYDRFLLSISNNQLTLDEISKNGANPEGRVSEFLQKYKDSESFKSYNYIVVDETQDILDSGIDILLDKLSSIGDDGLQNGRFLVFYDTDQAYQSSHRNLDSFANRITANAAMFKMLVNKRVGTNLDIYKYSVLVREAQQMSEVVPLFDEIESQKGLPINIRHVKNAGEAYAYVCQVAADVNLNRTGNDTILLTHSNIGRTPLVPGNPHSKTLIDMLDTCRNCLELTTNNINRSNEGLLMRTTMLKFKGLERKWVHLLVKTEDYFDCYELFVGMSRAIMELNIILLD